MAAFSAHRLLHQFGDLRLVGGGQLRERVGVGHMAPSSRFAASSKPIVAYLDLNLTAGLKKQTTLPSLAYAGVPYQVLRPGVRRAGGDDRVGGRPLPSRFDGNWSQPVATVWACSSRFQRLPICHRLPLVATALHQRCSMSGRLLGMSELPALSRVLGRAR